MKAYSRELRAPKNTDQENAEKGYRALIDFMRSYPEIEPTLWFSVFMSALVNGCINSGLHHDDFSQMLDDCKKHYKPWFDGEKDA